MLTILLPPQYLATYSSICNFRHMAMRKEMSNRNFYICLQWEYDRKVCLSMVLLESLEVYSSRKITQNEKVNVVWLKHGLLFRQG